MHHIGLALNGTLGRIMMDFVIMQKGEPMSDLIDRQAAIDALDAIASELHERKRLDEEYIASWCAEIIEGLPAIEPRPRGQWLPDNRNYYEERFVCSVCRKSYEVDTCMGEPTWDFCPCGADMRKEDHT